MRRRAQIHLDIVQDEVFQVDELAGEPQAGAGVMKMGAGAKTVANRAGAQSFVEAGEGVLGLGDRDQEFGVAKDRREGFSCFTTH